MVRSLFSVLLAASAVLSGCIGADDGPTSDHHDQRVTADRAREVIRSAYPNLNFGRDVMSGTEFVNGAWIEGYMMSATVGVDVLEVVVDAHSGEIVKEVMLSGFAAPRLGPCTVGSIGLGAWYNQHALPWGPHLLGNSSSDTIANVGCVLTTLAMVYNDAWSTSTNPDQLNTSAKSSGCFGAGSSLIDVNCAINSRGGPHSVSDVSMTDVATQVCNNIPVMVDVTWGTGHKMLVFQYTGGSTSSMASYAVVDPWDGTNKPLTSYTATRWRKLQ